MNETVHFFQEERLEKISDLIKERGRITVKELSDLYDISLVTVRKDLKQLEAEGKIIKTHGGAISKEEMSSQLNFELRKTKNIDKKRSIGKKAATLVTQGTIIFIDASTTAVEMCPYLTEIEELTVVTNSIEVAYILGKNSYCNVVVIGGGLKKENLSLINTDIEKIVSVWQIDIAFFGGWGFSIQKGLTDIPGLIAHQKRIIALYSQVKVGLIDSTKIEKGSLDTFVSSNDLNILVTNKDLESRYVESINKTNIKLIFTE